MVTNQGGGKLFESNLAHSQQARNRGVLLFFFKNCFFKKQRKEYVTETRHHIWPAKPKVFTI